MTTIYVTYTGPAEARFDRDYYVTHHLALVLALWGPYGLESARAFFPDVTTAGTIAICECQFRDPAAVEAAFGSPERAEVMADVPKFTDVTPARLRAVPL